MRYRDEFMNKMPPVTAPQQMQQMTSTCGAYNGGMPVVVNHGGYQLQPHMYNGSVMGAQQKSTPLPADLPAGGPAAPLPPAATDITTTAAAAVTPGWTQLPTTVESVLFTPGFLRTQIGKRVRVEFLLGTNLLTDRTGTLVAVGASYILLRPIDSDDLMMCDIYSIKFVTIIL